MKNVNQVIVVFVIFIAGILLVSDSWSSGGLSDFEYSKRLIEKIPDRFAPPEGYQRKYLDRNSFAHYLRHLQLKPIGSKVLYYNGDVKPNDEVYVAVVDLPIGRKDLHQCADAVMRLRADYLYAQKRYEDIHFNFTNGFRVDYSEYIKGKRIVVQRNKTYWKQSAAPSNTPNDFKRYKEQIYMYAGTLSLSKELIPVKIENMQIGDVFIQGGSPGHAVIVVDMVENDQGEKMFMLAQSYMPAQEIQILENPADPGISPWYHLEGWVDLYTPEWNFIDEDLKRFPEE
ncbi:DUF4846 domain-containing protein [bacterium SCSIO 12643]|nr:DUF4846 domain-containing protein [bacterium SCSIO 12643]